MKKKINNFRFLLFFIMFNIWVKKLLKTNFRQFLVINILFTIENYKMAEDFSSQSILFLCERFIVIYIYIYMNSEIF